jgi:VIT1/CCC1 family predicted Fe2+/Mn2+ transporter
MSLGEWISVQSSRELYEHQIKIEAEEVEQAPEEEAEELALIYEASGLEPSQARTMADQIISNRDSALDVMAREELGIDPQELGGSALQAAITSFVLFALGAIIPVIPYTFMSGTQAIIFSVIFSMVGLFGVGAAITLLTGRSVLFSGGRMMIFGLGAALLTFGVGRLIGVSVGG